MTFLRTLLFVALAAWLTPLPVASACSCALAPIPAARRQATAVFEGEVLRIIPAPANEGEVLVVMRVIRVWKGAIGREVRLLAFTPGMCPPHLAVGSTMILYPEGDISELHIRRCSRWAQNLRTERRELGRPLRRY